ncbi:unnamed protein product [Lactuca virosa]|uniref:Non-haem dioxygenase N-terminal domain-containing protein n=1 Tax=Lactuca virosa TaxID=75947 RepID=A0AAU9PFV5_9ASTR|nr:unnamed protein product [Lactuca virosa]
MMMMMFVRKKTGASPATYRVRNLLDALQASGYSSGWTSCRDDQHQWPSVVEESNEFNILIIDLNSDDAALRKATLELISDACREWGFFQVVNHRVSHQLMAETQKECREFFQLTVEEKQKYANSPETYEGYASHVGVVKGAKLDWSDYFFPNYQPLSSRDDGSQFFQSI